MPRLNSVNSSTGDQINANKFNNINADLDDIYAVGDDRLKTWRAVSGTALKIDIGAGRAVVGTTKVSYAGGTDISVTDSATNYVEINSSGTIDINTTGWTTTRTPLATVVCAGGTITLITDYRPVAFGGELFTQTQITYTAEAGENITIGKAVIIAPNGKVYKADYLSTSNHPGKVGIAQNTATIGNDVTICFVGIDANQTGMTPGNIMYLSDTPGEITATPGTRERPIGFALSATHLMIEKLIYERNYDYYEGTIV